MHTLNRHRKKGCKRLLVLTRTEQRSPGLSREDQASRRPCWPKEPIHLQSQKAITLAFLKGFPVGPGHQGEGLATWSVWRTQPGLWTLCLSV